MSSTRPRSAPAPHPTAWHFTATDPVGLALLSDAGNVRRFEHYAGSSAGPDGCHVWTGKRQRGNKTGVFTLYGAGCPRKGRSVSAPRMAWAVAYGPIPEGHVIRQTCGTDGCSNVRHLAAVLMKGKVALDLRYGTHPCADELAKENCPAGHPYTPDNLVAGNGSWRKCAACHLTHQTARYARHRARILARRRELRILATAMQSSNLLPIEVAS